MGTTILEYTSTQKLDCGGCLPKPVRLAIPYTIAQLGICFSIQRTISADLIKITCRPNSCGVDIFKYTFSYDDTQIRDGQTLTAEDIQGVFCYGPEVWYAEDYAGGEVTVFTDADKQILITQHQCHIPLAPGSACTEDVICTPVTLAEDKTYSNSLTFLKGGVLTTAGHIATIEGPFTAGPIDCFNTTAGEIVFGKNATLQILPEWFGAAGDGTTDDTVAIQLALDTAAASKLPIKFMPNKTYVISNLTIPQYAFLSADGGRRSPTIIKANSSSEMLTLSSTPDTFITIRGIQFDGNNTAASCINLKAANVTVIEDCAFANADILLDLREGPIWNYITRCEFQSAPVAGIQISGLTIATYISQCTFGGTSPYSIYTDASWTGDSLVVSDSTFGTTATDMINVLRDIAAGGNVHFFALRNRFDGAPANSNINIGQNVIGSLEDNSSTSGSPYGFVIDGTYVSVVNNFFSQAAIAAIHLTTNASNCNVGSQKWGALGGGADRIVDGGNRTILGNNQQLLKGITALRPSGLQAPLATQYGLMYLDTTLDPDGLPIWWQGTKWIKADGSDA